MSIDTAFTHFPSLTTNRLHLRQIQPTDAEAYFAIKSDPEVMAAYGFEPYESIEKAHAMIQRLQATYEQRDGLYWAITFKGEETVIGSCSFWNFSSDFYTVEVGYELGSAYWRQGIMAEALPAIITYGFTELGLHRIEANTFTRNTSSRNLLLKHGFKYEGTLRERSFFRGHFDDHEYYGLLKDEWQRSKSLSTSK